MVVVVVCVCGGGVSVSAIVPGKRLFDKQQRRCCLHADKPRVYQGVRVKTTVKELLQRHRAREANSKKVKTVTFSLPSPPLPPLFTIKPPLRAAKSELIFVFHICHETTLTQKPPHYLLPLRPPPSTDIPGMLGAPGTLRLNIHG